MSSIAETNIFLSTALDTYITKKASTPTQEASADVTFFLYDGRTRLIAKYASQSNWCGLKH